MAFLIVYCNNEIKFKMPLQPVITRIGRASENDVVIDNAGVSAYHARIVHDGDRFFIEDKHSTNGVFVNGKRISRAPLHFGDQITIYKHCLRFSAVDLPLPTADPAVQVVQPFNTNPTVEVDTEQLQELLKERQNQFPYLLQTNGNQTGKKFVLSKPCCNIGNDADCDINIEGWFTPRLAAKIARQSSGYFIFPEKGRNIRLNGRSISEPAKLHPRDSVEVRGVRLTYYEPTPEQPSTF